MPQPLMGITGYRKCVRVTAAGAAPPTPAPTTAAPLAIQFAVGVGGKNLRDDVGRIQEALNRVPVAQGGPAPPLAVDSWIGPNTCGAIKKFQVYHFGPAKADGRVDPNQYTIAKLREFQTASAAPAPGCGCPPKGGNGFALVSTKSAPAADPCPDPKLPVMDRVYDSLPICRTWILAALARLNEALKRLQGTATVTEFMLCTASLDLVDRCFKVKSLKELDAVAATKDLRFIFQKMLTVVVGSVKGQGYFYQAPPGTEKEADGTTINAFTYPGGFTRRDKDGKIPMANPDFSGPNLSQNGIYMCEPSIANMSCDNLVDLMNHEMAHFCGPEAVGDRVGDPSGGLAALELPHHTAARSATNYAWLAWLARLPRDQWMTNKG